MTALGHPRLHLRVTDSTNEQAKTLALAGAVHGTLVTASEQTAGRGRQGRTWNAPPGRSLLCTLVLRDPPELLPLLAGVAVAEAADAHGATPAASVKWPNDVVLVGPGGALRKLAGVLAEGRPHEGWAVLGIGVNVAVDPADLPRELRATAATLGLAAEEVERFLDTLLSRLEHWLGCDGAAMLAAWSGRDALAGRTVRAGAVTGRAAGVDTDGRLLVEPIGGQRVAVGAGEVHLGLDAAQGLR